MTETVYFATALPVDNDGKVRGSFNLSDLITQFRISAHAFDWNGTIGETQKAF